MPRAFSEREKALIRAALQSKGRELFGTYGLRKTNVEQLAKAAGISKGAFYLFYDSKEALFFELLEEFEASYKTAMLEAIAQETLAPHERLKLLLHNALAIFHNTPLFAQFAAEEYEYLSRKLPEERIQTHLQNDERFSAEFIAAWQSVGVRVACSPALVTGLVRALFVLKMHAQDISPSVHGQVIDTYVELLAGYLLS